MFKPCLILAASVALCALACDDAELDGGGGQAPTMDARVGQEDRGVTPRLDAGPQDDATPPPPDGAVPVEDLGTPDPDATRPLPDAAPPPPDAEPLPPPPDELVAAIVLSETPQANLSSALVSVSEPIEIGGAPGCVVQNVNANAMEAQAPSYDAGDIVVEGLADGMPLRFTRRGNRYEPTRAVPTDLFRNGGRLVARGEGGAAFGAFNLEFPAADEVNLTAPSNLGTPRRSEALSVRWGGGNGDTVLITLVPTRAVFSTEPASGNWIFCGAEDVGGFDIPAEAMRQFPSNIIGQGALLVVTRFTVRTGRVGTQEAVAAASTSTGVILTVSN